MIFSELYSAYYNTVAKIMEAAFNPEATEKDLQRCVMEEAFSESVLQKLPALVMDEGDVPVDQRADVRQHLLVGDDVRRAPEIPQALLALQVPGDDITMLAMGEYKALQKCFRI